MSEYVDPHEEHLDRLGQERGAPRPELPDDYRKDDARLAEFQRDYVAQLEAKDAELDSACGLLLDIEGALLGYWTDLPQSWIQETLPRIRAYLGDWEPRR